MEKYLHISVILYISTIISGFALIFNGIGIHLTRKQGPQRTHQNLIILHLSVLQIPISITALTYWISMLIYRIDNDIIIGWTVPILISCRIAVNLIIAILTAERLLAIKYSFRYMTIVSKLKLKVALIASWLPWVVSFSILASLAREMYEQVLIIVVNPVLDCLLLVFILYTYSYICWRIRKRRRMLIAISANIHQTQDSNKQALRVSTAIIVSYIIFVVMPDIADSILERFMEGETLEVIMLTAHMLNSCYYLALPIIYIFLQRNVRERLLETVVKCCSRIGIKTRNVNMISVKEERVQDVPIQKEFSI